METNDLIRELARTLEKTFSPVGSQVMATVETDENSVTLTIAGDLGQEMTYRVELNATAVNYFGSMNLPELPAGMSEEILQWEGRKVAERMCPCPPDHKQCGLQPLKNLEVSDGMVRYMLDHELEEDEEPLVVDVWEELMSFVAITNVQNAVMLSIISAEKAQQQRHQTVRGMLSVLEDLPQMLEHGCGDRDCEGCYPQSVPVEEFECLDCGGTDPDCPICGPLQAMLSGATPEEVADKVEQARQRRDQRMEQDAARFNSEEPRSEGMNKNPGRPGQERPADSGRLIPDPLIASEPITIPVLVPGDQPEAEPAAEPSDPKDEPTE